MKNAPMRFDSLGLSHNPSKLRITDAANVRELVSPTFPTDSVHLGRGLRKIYGEGELCGADCIDRYRALEQKYQSGKKGLLCLPHMRPIFAYLQELSMTAEPVEDVLRYSFVFVETRSRTEDSEAERYYITTDDGESLWDISFDRGVAIDELVRLNPQIEYIDNLSMGERVRLC